MAQPPSRRSVLETALAHLRGGRPRDALGVLEAEAREHGEDPELAFLSGLALEDLGQPAEALQAYERVLASGSNAEDAFHNRGLLLVRLGRLREAEESHRRYVGAHPDSERARMDLADVLLAEGRYEEALAEVDVIPEERRNAPILVTRVLALASLGRFAEAEASLLAARQRDPEGFARHVARIAQGGDPQIVLAPENVFLWRGYVAQQQCEWSGWDRYVAQFRKAAHDPDVQLEPALSFAALHVPMTPRDRLALAKKTAARIEKGAPRLTPYQVRRGGKLRVGIISPDFRDHLNARLLLPLFAVSDRRVMDVVAYSLSADDGSAILKRIKASAAGFVDLAPLSDQQAAARIRDDQVDILVDVGGHTAGARFGIVARRPAPIQVLYLGFASSLGSPSVDYAVVDSVVAPAGSDGDWTEALVRLPSTYYLYDFRERVDQKVSRAEYGLPDDRFVFCAFHKAEKISPDSFDVWMAILREVKDSVLWFLAFPEAARASLRKAAEARGVDPARLVFAPFEARERYLARQRLGDLMVDAVHHNAMTTACDAMGMGLPLLTLKGRSMVSRAGESLVRAAGMPELVAADSATFIEQAVRLAQDREEMRRLRERLGANRESAPLFDTAGRVQELEAAFEEMWRRHLAGELPGSFDVVSRESMRAKREP